jgi:hypothetical protein
MHCGSSLLCHILLRACCSTNGPASCLRQSKQGLHAVQYRTSKTTNVTSKANHTCCSSYFLQIKRAIVAAQKTSFAKLALIDIRRHGGVKVPHLALFPRHAVSLSSINTGWRDFSICKLCRSRRYEASSLSRTGSGSHEDRFRVFGVSPSPLSVTKTNHNPR